MYLLPGHVTSISESAVADRAKNDKQLEALYDPVSWEHSHQIHPSLVHESGSFTTLPVRMNDHDDIANAASERIARDWAEHIGDGQDKLSLASPSEHGNLSSFTFIEAPPNRLDLVTYWMDLGLLHDDHTESVDEVQAGKEHNAFSAGIDYSRALDHEDDSSRAIAMRRIAAGSMIQGLEIDRKRCCSMIDKYRKDWVDITEQPRPATGFQFLTEYMNYRNNNVGMSALWPMIHFGMGWEPSDEEESLIMNAMEPIEEGICLTNDYWSWEREKWDAETNGNRINNVIEVVMRIHNYSEEDAKKWLRDRLVGLECEYVQRKLELYTRRPDLTPKLRKWIDLGGHVIAGTHYWASRAPRHHSFKEHRQRAARSLKNNVNVDFDFSQARRELGKSCSSESTNASTSDDDAATASSRTTASVSLRSPPSCTKERTEAYDEYAARAMSVLKAPSNYIRSLPSKGIRSLMIEAFNLWTNVPLSVMATIEAIIDNLHNASLIADDIEDNSPVRRGHISTHLIFGQGGSINSSNFMFVASIQRALTLSNPAEAVVLVCQGLEKMYRGQAMDIYWTRQQVVPNVSDYLHMVDDKTGGLFHILLSLVQNESCVSLPVSRGLLDRLVLLLGRFFQIRDDYMNLASQEYTRQKGVCEDLDEGKASYPLVALASCDKTGRRLDEVRGMFKHARIESNGGLSTYAKMRIMHHLQESGALEATRSRIVTLEKEIEGTITLAEKEFGAYNPLMRLLVKRLSVQ